MKMSGQRSAFLFGAMFHTGSMSDRHRSSFHRSYFHRKTRDIPIHQGNDDNSIGFRGLFLIGNTFLQYSQGLF